MTDRHDRTVAGTDLYVYAAADTVPLLIDRITQMLRHGRRLTIVQRLLDNSRPRVHCGLRVESAGPAGHGECPGFLLRVSHGPLAIGFAAPRASEMSAEAARRHARLRVGEHPRDLTIVEICGGAAAATFDDQIAITEWNEHGVGQETIIAFEH